MKSPPPEKMKNGNHYKAPNGKKKRLGGKGLSLEAFANAKTKRTDFNPALIKKQKEFYRNAKYIKKFKRTLKQQTDNHPSTSTIFQQENEEEAENDRKVKKHKKNGLQSLRGEYEKKREEMEKARMEREAAIRAKNEERERAQSRRKELKHKMLKKTRSGQPVMKYRIERILESIQGSTDN